MHLLQLVTNANIELSVRQAGEDILLHFFFFLAVCSCSRNVPFLRHLPLLFLTGSIYFKNFVQKNWSPLKDDDDEDDDEDVENAAPQEIDPTVFQVPEQDKAVVRANILESVIYAPTNTRSQLLTALGKIAHADYPDKFQDFMPKLMKCLTSNDQQALYGALLSLYELVKKYEYDHSFFGLFITFYSMIFFFCLAGSRPPRRGVLSCPLLRPRFP